MITADPQRRVSTLARILDHVSRTAPDADRDLLLALAPVVYGDMPDPLALRLTPEHISARLAGIFRFVARTMPPAVQLYKGLPGLHVAVRNADEAEARADGSTHEVTIVETHSPDAPFVFESLKNYFKKEGLRVFSSIHPIFSVRRQWERVVWIGGPQEDGSRELYCQFRIERVEARDRVRRIEHQVFSVLKAVFLGVEDFPAMRRGVAELAPRLRDRRGESKDADAARSFLDWLMADNYVLDTSALVGSFHDTADLALLIDDAAAGKVRLFLPTVPLAEAETQMHAGINGWAHLLYDARIEALPLSQHCAIEVGAWEGSLAVRHAIHEARSLRAVVVTREPNLYDGLDVALRIV